MRMRSTRRRRRRRFWGRRGNRKKRVSRWNASRRRRGGLADRRGSRRRRGCLADRHGALCRRNCVVGRYASAASPTQVVASTNVPADAVCSICGENGEEHVIVRAACACRGAAELVHLTCLVREAVVSAKDQWKADKGDGMADFDKCARCKGIIRGFARIALAWGCWKVYSNKPVNARERGGAMLFLGVSLCRESKFQDAEHVTRQALASFQQFRPKDHLSFLAHETLALVLANKPAASYADKLEAVALMEKSVSERRQLYGPTGADVLSSNEMLQYLRTKLAAASPG